MPGHLVGRRTTTADLSLLQVVEGLRYAFPRAMARLEPQHARVIALRDLAKYVDPDIVPADPWSVIEMRKRRLDAGNGH